MIVTAQGTTNGIKVDTAGLLTASAGVTVSSGNVAITAGVLTLNGTTRIDNSGVGTFVTGTVIGSQTFTTNNIADSGALTIKSATSNALTLDSGTTGTVNLGTSNNAKTINIGTGTAGNTIHIGDNDTTADTITLGSAKDSLTLRGTTLTIGNAADASVSITDDNWSVNTSGVASFASVTAATGNVAITSGVLTLGGTTRITNAGVGTFITGTVIGSQTFTTNNIADSGALTIATGSNGNLNLSPNGTGDVVITPDSDTNLQITASGAPGVDMVAISNSTGVTTANVNGLSINYTGGSAAVEAAAQRIDLTPGGTANGTWNGLRLVANATPPVDQVTENLIKIEGPTSTYTAGGIANGIEVKNPSLSAALNVEEASTGIVMNSPFGGVGRFENYVTRSEEFDNSDWTKEDQGGGAGVTVTANNTAGPADTTSSGNYKTADKLADNATAGTQLYQSATAGTSETWTFSVWVKNNDATGSFKLALRDNSITGTASTNTITIASPQTDNWQRYSVTRTTANSSVTAIVAVIDVNQGDSTRSIYIWGAQLEKQKSPGVYVKTMSSALAYQGSQGLTLDTNLNNTTSSGFVYGSRIMSRVTSGTAGTHDQLFVRIQDDTSLANTVRGLDVQAWNGSNTAGTNIGVDAYGKTFGISGTTDALAGNVSTPAAVFAYLKNGSGAEANGNAIRAYSDKATGATMVSVYQENAAFTGNGLVIDLGNGTGSFNSGNFISLKNAGTQKFHVTSTGATFVSLPGTQNTVALCHANNGQSNNDEIVDCSGAPSDVAEMFGTTDAAVEAADVVTQTGESTIEKINDYVTTKSWVMKSSKPYDSQLLGVVSTQPSALYGDEIFAPNENPRPIALTGRVPVKVNLENGPIHAGDYLTSSSTTGQAMKATAPGMVIGQALSSFDGTQADAKVVVFVSPFYYDPTVLVDGSGNVTLQRAGSTTFEATTDAAALLVNQKGAGDLLQLQANDVNLFAVKNYSADTDNIVVVSSKDADVFTINARGQATIAGNIIVKEDSFAGSIATDQTGAAKVMFAYDLGSGKPDVQLTVEGETPALAQITGWEKASGNYTGFDVKTFKPDGTPASVIVHYLVIGKEKDYATSGTVVEVVNQPSTTTTTTPPVDSTSSTTTPTDTTTTPTNSIPTDTTTSSSTTGTTTVPDTTTTAPTDSSTTTTTTPPVDSTSSGTTATNTAPTDTTAPAQ